MNRRLIIVGSGQSAKGFIPPDDVDIMAINGSIEWLPRADMFFTLDHSEANLKRLNNPRPGTKYYCAFPNSVPTPDYVTRYERYAHRGDEPKGKGTPEYWLWRWSSAPTLSTRLGIIHSGNSAWGGLGLAYQLGYDHVALIGVDATQDPRIEGGIPNNLSHLPLLFKSALNQIDVVSLGKLDSIPQMTLEQWIEHDGDSKRTA